METDSAIPTVERQKDPLAVELGRRGMAKRWSPEAREKQREVGAAVGRHTTMTRLVSLAKQLEEFGLFGFKKKRAEDPEAYIASMWASSLPHEWEQLLDVAKLARDWDLVQRVLVAMTAMTPALSPLKMRAIAQSAADQLPGDMADLSQADDEMLAKLTGKRVGQRGRDGGREPEGGVDLDLEPDRPTKKSASKSKKKAKRKEG